MCGVQQTCTGWHGQADSGADKCISGLRSCDFRFGVVWPTSDQPTGTKFGCSGKGHDTTANKFGARNATTQQRRDTEGQEPGMSRFCPKLFRSAPICPDLLCLTPVCSSVCLSCRSVAFLGQNPAPFVSWLLLALKSLHCAKKPSDSDPETTLDQKSTPDRKMTRSIFGSVLEFGHGAML